METYSPGPQCILTNGTRLLHVLVLLWMNDRDRITCIGMVQCLYLSTEVNKHVN